MNNLKKVGLTALACLLYTSPSPRDATLSRMPSSAWKKNKSMGVGGIFIGTLALIFAIVIIMEIKQRLF